MFRQKLAASPPIIVAIHYCSGTAQACYDGSPYAQLADQKELHHVIYPESPYRYACSRYDARRDSLLTSGLSVGLAGMLAPKQRSLTMEEVSFLPA